MNKPSSVFSIRNEQMKEHPKTPLIPISLILTLAITIAKYSHGHLDSCLWLTTTFLTWGIAASLFILRHISRHALHLSLFLYLSLFCLGGTITSYNLDEDLSPVMPEAKQEFSHLDHVILTVQSYRKQLEQKMKSLHIEEQDYAVISAMALGDKSALDAETRESYSVAGTSHVLAVSGLHIAIIFQVILLMLGGKRKSRLTIIISTIVVWAYVVLIGLPASAIRSATMISLYGFGLLAKRQGPSINTLSFAYVVMLFLNPLSLFEISFQLSFLAVASILLFQPLIAELHQPHHKLTRWAWQLLSVSVAAQLGTLPIIVYYFGRISCYSVLTSFVAIPMATLVLYLCAVLLALHILTALPYVSVVASFGLQFTAHCLVEITQLGNNVFHLVTLLPGASIDDVHINLIQVLLLYLIIFFGYFFWSKIEKHNKQQQTIK